MSDENFLSRWSRRKLAGKAEPRAAVDANLAAEGVVRAQAAAPQLPATATQAPATAAPPEPLPPIESLTSESDFTPFMRPGVDPATRRAALKVLVRDPRFNVMDGLDVYIDDYTKSDPIPDEWMGQLKQLARLGDFRPQEPETPQEGENPGAAPQTELKATEEQPVGEVKVDDSSDTVNKGEEPPAVQQS